MRAHALHCSKPPVVRFAGQRQAQGEVLEPRKGVPDRGRLQPRQLSNIPETHVESLEELLIRGGPIQNVLGQIPDWLPSTTPAINSAQCGQTGESTYIFG